MQKYLTLFSVYFPSDKNNLFPQFLESYFSVKYCQTICPKPIWDAIRRSLYYDVELLPQQWAS